MPVNENNNISKLERRLGYTFADKNILKTALTHRSKSKINNERYEFFGDALLQVTISEYLFHARPDCNEGELTRLRATVVRGKTLALLAEQLELKNYMIVGTGELRTGGYQRESTIADALEAIFAAIMLDSNDITIVKKVIIELYNDFLLALPEVDDLIDSKTRLQEKLQAIGAETPQYELIDISGPDHNKIFKVSCNISKNTVTATGSSKKKAEQEAANIMLKQHYK